MVTTPIHVRVEDRLLARIMKRAEKNCVPTATMIRLLLAEKMNELESPQQATTPTVRGDNTPSVSILGGGAND